MRACNAAALHVAANAVALFAAAGASLFAAAMLVACSPAPTPPAPPPPAELHAEAVGHYCRMLLVDHEGPKGQVHLASRKEPVWFSSVRDTLAFMRLPEEPRDISAVYVNDMGRAKDWSQPEPGLWVDPRQAWFVIDSKQRGGMGAPEAVPFSSAAAADAFRTAHQGRVVRLADIPDAYVLGAVDLRGTGSRPQPGASHPSP